MFEGRGEIFLIGGTLQGEFIADIIHAAHLFYGLIEAPYPGAARLYKGAVDVK